MLAKVFCIREELVRKRYHVGYFDGDDGDVQLTIHGLGARPLIKSAAIKEAALEKGKQAWEAVKTWGSRVPLKTSLTVVIRWKVSPLRCSVKRPIPEYVSVLQ